MTIYADVTLLPHAGNPCEIRRGISDFSFGSHSPVNAILRVCDIGTSRCRFECEENRYGSWQISTDEYLTVDMRTQRGKLFLPKGTI